MPNPLLASTIGDGRTVRRRRLDGTLDLAASVLAATELYAPGPFSVADVLAAFEADRLRVAGPQDRLRREVLRLLLTLARRGQLVHAAPYFQETERWPTNLNLAADNAPAVVSISQCQPGTVTAASGL